MIRIARHARPLLAASLLWLSACGGGGGGGGGSPAPPPPPAPPVAQTISFATAGPIAKVVGDAPFTNTASGGAGTGAITYSSDNPAAATVGTDTGSVSLVSAGTVVITATKAASTGFLAATATYTVNVAPPPPVAQVITFANAGPVAHSLGDAPFTNAASGGAGTGAITYSSGTTSVATVNATTGEVTIVGVGTSVVTADKAASAGFLAATATYTLTVSAAPAPQTISFATPGPISRTYGDPAFTNAASGGAGTGAITYLSGTPSVATVGTNTGLVTLVGAGSTTITATKAASAGFAAATANYTLNVARAQQIVAFHYPGPLSKREYDLPLFNPARGLGNGAVTYSSSNNGTAMVDTDTGLITFMGVGTATITALKAQSATHLAGSATYVINIVSRGRNAITAWIGADDTQVEFAFVNAGSLLFRSDTLLCPYNSFDTCPLTQAPFPSTSFTDSATRLFNPTVFALQRAGLTARPTLINGGGYPATSDNEVVEENGTLWSFDFAGGLVFRSNDGRAWEQTWTPMPYGIREGAAAVAFKNSLWVIGGNMTALTGTSPPGTPLGEKADVYSLDTFGGGNAETGNAAFGARKFHRIANFNNKLWLIGGQRGTPAQYLNDIWSSDDGVTWTRVTAAAPFAPRAEHALTVFAGRLWLVGGRNGSGTLKDVWSSFDGESWTHESDVGTYGRYGHRVVGHNGSLYVLGQAEFNDNDYRSVDGVTWTPTGVTVPAWLTRFAAIEFRFRIWLLGGTSNLNAECCSRSDVWSTTDANYWQLESLGSPFSSMPGPKMTVFNNELYLNASSSWERSQEQRIYKTSNLIDWTKAEPPSPIMVQAYARSESPLVVFNSRLYMLGGRSLDPYTFHTVWGDVTSTADGSTWTNDNQNAFLPRYGHSAFVLGGRMFVLGGYNDLTQQLGDIHSTANGSVWRTDVATSTNIGLRSYGETVVFNNRVWLLGGEKNGSTVSPEIWSSADGITWQLEKANEQATTRTQFGAVVWNGRIWIAGGKDLSGNLQSDVWSSADGTTWRLETASAMPIPRARIALAVFNNKLYMFGGEAAAPRLDAGRGINEMWMSADGATWRRLYRNEVEIP